MASSGLLESLLAGLQASVSVLLVISYGGLAAKLGLLSPESTKAVSKVCVRMFLPALLVTKIGSQLHADSSDSTNYGIVLLWGLLAHFISFLVGIFGHLVLKMPDWVTVGVMFNNTASYPLLLIGALQQTGILASLVKPGASLDQAIERANAYFLVFSTVSSCLTFAVGPRLIDSEHAPEEDPDAEEAENDNNNAEEPNEETGLLGSSENNFIVVPTFHNPFNNRDHRSFFPSTRKPSSAAAAAGGANGGRTPTTKKPKDRRASLIPHTHWSALGPRTKWWLLFLFDFFNMPLLGALLGAIIGLTPPLHRAFFNDTYDGGIFTAWLTASLKNIGGLFVPLPVVIAGTSLYAAYTKSTKGGKSKGLPWGTVAYIMLVRFVLWPVASIGVVYLLASRTSVLGEDPMLWFAMMLMPW